jgi:hypothetical protein
MKVKQLICICLFGILLAFSPVVFAGCKSGPGGGGGDGEPTVYTVVLDAQGGSGGTASVEVVFDEAMPEATKPVRANFTFAGFFAAPNGAGTKYYDANMMSVNNWDIEEDGTIFAHWVSDYNPTAVSMGNFSSLFGVQVTYPPAGPNMAMIQVRVFLLNTSTQLRNDSVAQIMFFHGGVPINVMVNAGNAVSGAVGMSPGPVSTMGLPMVGSLTPTGVTGTLWVRI